MYMKNYKLLTSNFPPSLLFIIRYVHLTNYSINKHSENYVANNDDLSDDESSSKWSI